MMNNTEQEKKERLRSAYYKVARNAAMVIAVFVITVTVIMTLSLLQARTHPPLLSPHLEELIDRAHRDGGEELKEAVLAYDLIARRAYFSDRAFMRFGAYLLLAGSALLVLLIKLMSDLKEKAPRPGKFTEVTESPEEIRALHQVLLGSGFFLLLVSVSLSFLYPGLIPLRPGEKVTHAATGELMNNWPAFRGFGGGATAPGEGYPLDWDGESGRNIAWKTAVPLPGVNSPVVWKGRVFLAGASEEAREVYCFDAATGEMLWSAGASAGSRARIPSVDPDTGLSAPTIATDGRHLGALFATGELLILDFEGAVTAEIQLGIPENIYGHSSSLAAYGGLLFVQYDHDAGSRLMALSMPSGRPAWERSRDVPASWSSPILAETESGMQLILTADSLISGYQPETGELVWEVPGIIAGEIGPSPAFSGGRLYAAQQYSVIAGIDTETREVLWTYDYDLPEASSPAAHGGFLVLPSSYEAVTLLDAETGEEFWIHRFNDDFYSSPVIAGGNVYITERSGVTRIFALEREFRETGNPSLGERVVSTPALADGSIYIRGENYLYRISEND